MILDRPKRFLAAALVLMIVGSGCADSTEEATREQPNILIVLADDMGYSDIGAFGSEIETPNIDGLARNGISFNNFHVGAACSPTRTMLMTGVDNHLAGLGNMVEIQADNQFGQPGYEGHLNESVVSVATLLRDGGYHTYMVGKWHLGQTETTIPHARGFDRSFALMESGADNWDQQPYMPMYEAVHYYDDDQEVALPTEDYFSTDYYTDRMIEYIGSNHEDGQPFFAYVAYQAVHYPHQAPVEYIDKYNGVYDRGWDALRAERLARQNELGVFSSDVEMAAQFDKTGIDDWKIPDWDAMSDEEKQFSARKMQTYAGMVDNMDVNVGRILSYLEEIGEADNTLVIFLADNGADPNLTPFFPGWQPWYEENFPRTYIDDYDGDFSTVGQSGSFSWYGPGWAAHANTPNSGYKTFSSEGGLRVPFIAHLPGTIPAGETNESFGFVKDIVPTLLEVAGLAVPGTTYNGRTIHAPTGTSMWSALTGQSMTIHDASEVIGYELAGSSAVFQGQYKLVLDLPPKGTGAWELYDMNADPAELNDLSAEYPDMVAELIQAYAQYESQNGVIPVPEGYNPLEQAAMNAARGVMH